MRLKIYFGVFIYLITNSSMLIDNDTHLVIRSRSDLTKFLITKKNNYTNIEIEGVLINRQNGFVFPNDSVFNKLQENNKLKRLKINGCHMKYIPNQICKIKTLVYLTLNDNNIILGNTKLKGLKNLEGLYLNQNGITSIESFIKSCKYLNRLQILSFDSNNIDSIPEEICDIKNLKVLHLQNNVIRNIPCSLNNKEDFELNLFLNNIKMVPCCFNKSYNTAFSIRVGASTIIPDCFTNSNIPINKRIRFD